MAGAIWSEKVSGALGEGMTGRTFIYFGRGNRDE